jgi:putative sterol carrier protein
MTIREALNKMKERFDPEKLSGFEGTFAFEIRDGDPEFFTISVKDGSLIIEEEASDDANCRIITDLDTFEAIMDGRKSAVTAFMLGKLKVKGDMNYAIRMNSIFFE